MRPAVVRSSSNATVDLGVGHDIVDTFAEQVSFPVRPKSLEIGIIPPNNLVFGFAAGETSATVPLFARMRKTFIGPVTYTWRSLSRNTTLGRSGVNVRLPGLDGSYIDATIEITATAGGLTQTDRVTYRVGNGNFVTEPTHGGVVEVQEFDYLGTALAGRVLEFQSDSEKSRTRSSKNLEKSWKRPAMTLRHRGKPCRKY